jgi:transposase
MGEVITYVGIDAHKRELQLAMLIGTTEQPISWTCPTDARALERLRRKLEREAPGAIECCYEAGSNGYALQRQLSAGRLRCRVIAPSLIPQKPGDRVKTNRRDARKLAHLLRAGLLTEVHPPTHADEAVRDLVRARDDARSDLMRSRHRLGKLLLRRALIFPGRNWTARHREWLQRLEWPHPAERHVVADYQLAIAHLDARLTEIDRCLMQIAITPPYAAAVAALRCFRGIETISAMTLLAELHDFRRFQSPRALMAFIGLVPSERSTGDRRRPGAITKMGNNLVRRVLVEAAWHYRHEPRLGVPLKRRRQGQAPAVIAIAVKAEQRLCRRYRRLCARLKPRPLVVTAVARELIGFLWAALQVPEATMRS